MLAGPDVSEQQGAIRWPRVRLADEELAFAFAKATEGAELTDSTFVANWGGIRERGLIRGAYHLARPAVSGTLTIAAAQAAARAEAEHMLSVLDGVGGIGDGDLSPALQIGAPAGLTAPYLYAWVQAWVEVVGSRVGRQPIICAGAVWRSTLDAYTEVWDCPLWLTDESAPPQPPGAWGSWRFWQCSLSGRLSGISGDVGLSYFNGSTTELEGVAGASQIPALELVAGDTVGRGGGGAAPMAPAAPPRSWSGRTLKLGDSGTDVRVWQDQMRRRGFRRLPANGVFGPQSVLSCRWLQLYLRVPVTGQVDEVLWHATWTAR